MNTLTNDIYVDSLHLNIGTGDCTLVCKLQHNSKVTTVDPDEGKPRLLSLVLIDGGYSSHRQVILRVLNMTIPYLYTVPSTVPSTGPKLQAVVITHYDRDHYEGVLDLIRSDLVEQVKKSPTTAATTGCRFFNYDATGRPQSCMYLPYWDVPEGVKKKGRLSAMECDIVSGEKILKMNIGTAANPVEIKNICRIRAGWLPPGEFGVKGRDFFTDNVADQENYANSMELAKTTGLALQASEPALVCVGADRESYVAPSHDSEDGGKADEHDDDSDEDLFVTNPGDITIPIHHPPLKVIDTEGVGTGNNEGQNTNASSIICTILWGVFGNVSHYLAGDAYWLQEEPVINWISAGNPSGATKEIGAVKLSHHGAAHSSPADLFRRLTPRTIIVSASTLHGHPRWETLLWLYLWFKTEQRKTRVCSTIYPYWLAWRVPPKTPTTVDTTGAVQHDDSSSSSSSSSSISSPAGVPLFTVLGGLKSTSVGMTVTDSTDINEDDDDLVEETRGSMEAFQRDVLDMFTLLPGESEEGKKLFVTEAEFQADLAAARELQKQKKHAVSRLRTKLYNFMVQAWPVISDVIPSADTYANYHGNDPTLFWRVCSRMKFLPERDLAHPGGTIQVEDGMVFRHSAGTGFCEFVQIREQSSEKFKHLVERRDADSLRSGGTAAVAIHPEVDTPAWRRMILASSRAVTAATTTPIDSMEMEQKGTKPDGKAEKLSARPSRQRPEPRPFSRSEPLIIADASPKVRPKALVASASGSVETGERHYILPDGFNISTFPVVPGVTRHSISPVSNSRVSKALNAFINRLHTRYFAVSASDASGKRSFLEEDDLRDWLVSAFDATGLFLTSSAVDLVSELSIELSAPWIMTFSTAANAVKRNFRNLNTLQATFAPLPLFPYGNQDLTATLILGLIDGSGSRVKTLGDVMTFIGMENDAVRGLAQTISLTLDDKVDEKDLIAPGTRNAFFFNPTKNYNTTLRLQFNISAFDEIRNFIHSKINSDLDISSAKVIARKQSHRVVLLDKETSQTGYTWEDDPQLVFAVTLVRKLDDGSLSHLKTAFDFTRLALTVVIQPEGDLEDMLGWLATLVGIHATSTKEKKTWIDKFAANILPREITLEVNENGVQYFRIDLEVDVEFGKDREHPSGDKVAFLLSYAYHKATDLHEITGALNSPALPGYLELFPEEFARYYEDHLAYKGPSGPGTYAESIHATALLPDLILMNIPPELELDIYALEVSISNADLHIEGLMLQDPERIKNFPPSHFSLEQLRIQGTCKFQDQQHGGNIYDVSLDGLVRLKGRENTPDAFIGASIAYNSASKEWHLEGFVDRLLLSNLVCMFPNTDGSAIMDIAEHIVIQKLYIGYTYTGGTDSANGSKAVSSGSSFLIKADLLLDVFTLDLTFNWDKSGEKKDWDFSATLKIAPGKRTTVKNLLNAASKDSSIVDIIPSFADITIGTDDMKGTGSGLNLHVKRSAVGNKAFLIFVLTLTINGGGNSPNLRFTFIQLKERVDDSSAAEPVTKRILKISVDAIPWNALPKIPIIGEFRKPFKELDYIWVGDSSNIGITREEQAHLNGVPEVGTIRAKDLVKIAERVPTNVLLKPGSHFLVVADDKDPAIGETVVLDYQFGAGAQGQPKGDGIIDDETGPVAKDGEDDNITKGDAATGRLQTSQGPLSISNVGFKYVNSKLQIFFDATVKMGPLEFSLLGFGIVMDLSGGISLRTLGSLRPFHGLDLTLRGLACEYNEPPLMITGLFEDRSAPGMVKFVGGIAVRFQPYCFMAVGSYGELTASDGHVYKSVFVFAKLNGPLIEFEFAEISGICGGFGYNSNLRFPTMDNVNDFPFVKGGSDMTTSDPLQLLATLTDDRPSNTVGGWVTSREGSIWLAAGLDIKAFQVLTVSSVVVLEFNPYVSLGLFGRAVARLPAAAGQKPPVSLVYAELGIAITVDFHGGVLRAEASLAPNSYILNPLCHLTGGFALCYWFNGSQYDGDWVFTVGGYHAAFQIPSHYPRPNRLGISWDLGGGLCILGEAYLAVTPKVCMVGGQLNAILDLGVLGAHFGAHADLMIRYKPFHVHGNIGIEVGVRFTLDLLIVTIHINVDISAELTIYGPPFGGDVWVDFWVFGFSIHFGDDENPDVALTLAEFDQLLQQMHEVQPAAVTATGSSAGNTKPESKHVLAVEKGRYIRNKDPKGSDADSTETPEGAHWLVKSQGFVFRVQSKFAIGQVSINGEDGSKTPNKIYAKPVQLKANDDPKKDQTITSTMNITISSEENDVGSFTYVPVLKKVPQALWGPYHSSEDPLQAGNNIGSLLEGNTNLSVELLMGVTLIAPSPQLAHDTIPEFDAKDASAANVYDQDGNDENPKMTALATASAAWNPAGHPGVQGDDASLWVNARNAWKDPFVSKSNPDGDFSSLATVANLWENTMNWDEGIDLTFPDQYVTDLEQYCMSAPFIGVA